MNRNKQGWNFQLLNRRINLINLSVLIPFLLFLTILSSNIHDAVAADTTTPTGKALLKTDGLNNPRVIDSIPSTLKSYKKCSSKTVYDSEVT